MKFVFEKFLKKRKKELEGGVCQEKTGIILSKGEWLKMLYVLLKKKMEGEEERKAGENRGPWWPSGLERYSTAREVRGSNPALGIIFALIKRLCLPIHKASLSSRNKKLFYCFATKRRWTLSGLSSSKNLVNINVRKIRC